MEFIYDGDNKSISSARHIAVFPTYFNYVGAYVSTFDYNIWLSNYHEIKRIAKFAEQNDDVIVSAQFQSLLELYESESKLSRNELINKYDNTIIIHRRGLIDEALWEDIKKLSDENYQKNYLDE